MTVSPAASPLLIPTLEPTFEASLPRRSVRASHRSRWHECSFAFVTFEFVKECVDETFELMPGERFFVPMATIRYARGLSRAAHRLSRDRIRLRDSVRTGESASKLITGCCLFQDLAHERAEDPKKWRTVFRRALGNSVQRPPREKSYVASFAFQLDFAVRNSAAI